MSAQEAKAEALQRIAHARETQATVLDLGDLPLQRPPEELATLDRLLVLALGRMAAERTYAGVRWTSDANYWRWSVLNDLGPLAGLSALTNLSLAGCYRIADLGPLAGLTALTRLDLSGCRRVTDLRPLAGLSNLTDLSLTGCHQVADLQPLAGLVALTRLRLTGCNGIRIKELVPILPSLKQLVLHGAKCLDLPSELYGKAGKNVLPLVRAYLKDLGLDPKPDSEVKIYLLGNGRVGKTKLTRRLRGLDYGPLDEPSTHGVRLYDRSVNVQGLPHSIRLNLWDFGGQDIYYGSHSLFLRGPAVFLLLWSPEHENDHRFEVCGTPLRNHRLPYWFDYLREVAGNERNGRRRVDSPVLLIQSQCDNVTLESEPLAELPGRDEFPHLQVLHVSAKNDYNLADVQADLGKAIRYLLQHHPRPPLGPGWVKVREAIRTMQAAEPAVRVRTMTRPQFDDLCAHFGEVSTPAVLLRFLHEAGVVFYRDGLFSDRIIIDQQWALDAIYTLFDRHRMVPHLIGDGRFTEQHLTLLAWSNFPAADRATFLRMMVQCGIAFRGRRLNPKKHPARHEYIAPEWLPGFEFIQAVLQSKLDTPSDTRAVARFRLLHDGIARGFLAKVGQAAADNAIYWKFGFWFRADGSEVIARIVQDDPTGSVAAGRVTIDAWGLTSEKLVSSVLETLDQVVTGTKPEVERFGYQPVQAPLGERPSDRAQLGVEGLSIGGPAPAVDNQVFVSYGWGDDSEEGRLREQLVSDLVEVLRQWGYQPFQDKKQTRYGDLISDVTKFAGTMPIVTAVLSEKYLKSIHCMSELGECYLCSGMRDNVFRERFKPLCLADAHFHTDDQRDGWGRYWDQQLDTALERMKQRRTLPMSAARLDRMCQWVPHVPRILNVVWEVLHPKGFKAIAADGFAALKLMLRRP